MARISLKGGHIDRKCVHDACVRCFAGRRVRRKKYLGALGEIQKEIVAYWVKRELRGGSREKCGCAGSETWPPSVPRRRSTIQNAPQEDLYVEFTPFGAQRAGQIPADSQTFHALKTAVFRCGTPEDGLWGLFNQGRISRKCRYRFRVLRGTPVLSDTRWLSLISLKSCKASAFCLSVYMRRLTLGGKLNLRSLMTFPTASVASHICPFDHDTALPLFRAALP